MITNGASKKLMADINVTPLVDVMLVLLIIFMVTVPMMKHGIDVNLPQTTAKVIKTDDERLIITIKKDGKIFVDDFETDLATLETKLEQIYRNRADKEALLHADAGLEYGYVVKVMNEVRKAGVTKLGMVTEPVEKEEKKEKK
jgi:biopolymer transport protein TolR